MWWGHHKVWFVINLEGIWIITINQWLSYDCYHICIRVNGHNRTLLTTSVNGNIASHAILIITKVISKAALLGCVSRDQILSEDGAKVCVIFIWITSLRTSKLTSIGSDNGLSHGRHQAIIGTNTGILLIAPLGTNFSTICFQTLYISFNSRIYANLPCCQYTSSHDDLYELYI